jgi:hypothetical protein
MGMPGIIAKGGTNEARECIGSQLITPLQLGIRYYASFKVSLIGRMFAINRCGINKLGILFSTVLYNDLSPAPICSNCAQICSDSIITDSLNWTRITGSFIADSNYSYITIGRLNLNSLTDSIQLNGGVCLAYYFIDDVCISTDSSYAYNYNWTGIEEISKFPTISIYPNPTTDFINIAFASINETYNISIFDVFGRELFFKQNISEPIEHIPIGSFNSSVLIIKIIYKNQTYNFKLIKI